MGVFRAIDWWGAGVVLAAVGAVFAVVDWWAVGVRRRRVEWVCKPAVVALLAVAVAAGTVSAESEAQRWWFVAALVLSLAGDVFLMFTPERDWFVPGLASFLLAHVAYAMGFVLEPGGVSWALVGVAVPALVVLGAVVGGRVLRSVDVAALRGAVALYMVAISVMVALAVGTGDWRAGAGASLFYMSDAAIAWNKFVAPFAAAKLFIIVTYHMAQFLLVWSLT